MAVKQTIVGAKSCGTDHIDAYLQGGAPKIAKLVYNSNNYGLWYL